MREISEGEGKNLPPCFVQRYSNELFWFIFAEDTVKEDAEGKGNNGMTADSADDNDHCKKFRRNCTQIQKDAADCKHDRRIGQEADCHIGSVFKGLLCAADKVGDYWEDVKGYTEQGPKDYPQ